MQNQGNKPNGGEKTCCNRDHSHKLYIFKRKVENLINQFELIQNYDKTTHLREDVFIYAKTMSEWLSLGIKVDIMNEHFQSIINNRGQAFMPVIVKTMQEFKKL